MSETERPEVSIDEEIDESELVVAPDAPTAAGRFGTTAAEQRRGETFDRRLAEEESETDVDAGAEEPELDAEDDAVRVVESADELGGATDDPVDHYLEGA